MSPHPNAESLEHSELTDTAVESKPLAVVRHYSPSGIPTTVVTCFNVTAILYAVEHGYHADSVSIQTPTPENPSMRARYTHEHAF